MHGAPPWWTPPDGVDWLTFAALALVLLAVLGVIHLYARFERYAERRSEGTPLRTTVPTVLTVALAYELFPPLSHFSVLLPAALFLAALARDFMLWWGPANREPRSASGEPRVASGAAEEGPANAASSASQGGAR